jgi:hypothetical protein
LTEHGKSLEVDRDKFGEGTADGKRYESSRKTTMMRKDGKDV